MKKLTVILFCCMIGLMGCFSNSPVLVHPGQNVNKIANRNVMLYYPNASETSFRAALLAAEEWNRTCNTNVQVYKEYYPNAIPIKELNAITDIDPDAPKWVRGSTAHNQDGDVIFVFIVRGLSIEDLTILFAHEFGHVLGIDGHTRTGLMTKTPTDRPQDWVVSENECRLLPNK